MSSSTGWFGRASECGYSARSTKVHALVDGKVLCGYKPHKTMSYQWCSAGIKFEYLECPRCKKKAGAKRKAQLQKELEKIEAELARLG